jgi:hypothetical protein
MLGVNKVVQTVLKHLFNIANKDGMPGIKKLQSTYY